MSNIDIGTEVYDLSALYINQATAFISFHTIPQYATYLQAKMDTVVSSSLEQQQ